MINLTLADIRDWLKTLNNRCNNYYIGRLDDKKEKSIGVYQLDDDSPNRICIGGLDNTKTAGKSISILIYYNKNASETEQFASSFFNELNELSAQSQIKIGNTTVSYIKLLQNEPIDVTGDSEIYKRVIEVTFFYNLER